ncbi:MAG: DUF433 domain-containing protein [Blastocatellia bacterium]
MKAGNRKEYGQYIVSDPEICGGRMTFKGTRIFVQDVLDMVAQGMAWSEITETWFGRVSHAAIAEAVKLANEALLEKDEMQRRAA